jgi:hypothetical protein
MGDVKQLDRQSARSDSPQRYSPVDKPSGSSSMPKVPDDITLGELCKKAAQSLTKAGLQHRIDIYRDVEVDDPAVRLMLGRAHKVRIRIKITAASLLFENTADNPPAPASEAEKGEPQQLAEVVPITVAKLNGG